MKRIVIFIFIFLYSLIGTTAVKAIDPAKVDWKLKFLLNDETDPFFPDTVRKILISTAMHTISASCKYASTAKDEAYIPGTGNITSVADFNFSKGGQHICNILGVKLKDTDYGLLRVNKQDIGLDKITTDQGAKYWYITSWDAYAPGMGVYNGVSESTAVEIYFSTVADWDSSRAFRRCFENEAVLYSLYLCYLRQGETEIAEFIKQIAVNEILDLKAILENHPVDITLAKESINR